MRDLTALRYDKQIVLILKIAYAGDGDFECFVCNLLKLIFVHFFLYTVFFKQIENLLGGEDTFRERLTNHLAQCLAQFAVASGSDAQWKPLNYQVLLKTRHSSATVSVDFLTMMHH